MMQIIQGTTDFEVRGKNAVAMGKFDGIHLGHQRLLNQLFEQKEQGQKAVVFTFDPPPSVFFGKSDGRELMTREEKRAAFAKLGIDILIEFPLNAETAAILPEDFITEILIKQLHAAFIAAGTDVSFGDKGAGNDMLLRSMAKHFSYQLSIIDKVCMYGREVSSTFVREAVEQGNMELAKQLLGKSFGIMGEVVHGNHFGRTMGMPTVNLLPEKNKLLPPNGVYFSEVYRQEKKYLGMTNIGYKPTVSEEKQLGAETYIYDFDQEIYGEKIEVRLLSFRRGEQKFAGKEELKEQIARDIEAGRIFHQI